MEHTEIENIGLLANYLKLEKSVLKMICDKGYENIEIGNSDGDSSEKKDLTLSLNKYIIRKKRGQRIVYSPYSDSLINCLKMLNTNLSKLYTPPDCVHGFVKGRNIKSNAKPHLAKNYIYKFDIENYFESIDSSKVIPSLVRLGFTEHASTLISKIVTHNDILVQGFHTSPTVANLVFMDLDEIFSHLDENIEYSRYADDIYFSTNTEINIHHIITENLSNYGFALNESKTKVMKRGQNQYVTGLTVFDSDYPRISKRIKKKLRQEIYFINKFGYKGHVFHTLKVNKKDYKNDIKTKEMVDSEMKKLHSRINGWLLFINSIEPEYSRKYFRILHNK